MAPPDVLPTSTQLVADRTGRLVLGAASQLGGAGDWPRRDFLDLLLLLESTALVLLGPPPYPETPLQTFVVDGTREFDLVHGRTGRVSKLFAVYNPALTSSAARRKLAAALAAPHLTDKVPPIVLIGGARSGGSVEPVGGAWVVQVGVFTPLEGAENIERIKRRGHKLEPSCGGACCRISLDDHDCPVVSTFMDYSRSAEPAG